LERLGFRWGGLEDRSSEGFLPIVAADELDKFVDCANNLIGKFSSRFRYSPANDTMAFLETLKPAVRKNKQFGKVRV
jgi:hypothetical protein